MFLKRVNKYISNKLWGAATLWFGNRGYRFGSSPKFVFKTNQAAVVKDKGGQLREYFERNTEGLGIWKWLHYFEIYHRHLDKFVGREQINILEIGVYSGGSLNMWREYLGEGCNVYGVDIEPACKNYESDHVKIYIGDQEDRSFWKKFTAEVDSIDIIIDDGGHTVNQQIATLEELLPFLEMGGVYICEDVHGIKNEFLPYVHGLCRNLNGMACVETNPLKGTITKANLFQSQVHSIHHYPFAVVVEKTSKTVTKFQAPKHGTAWQPFFEAKK